MKWFILGKTIYTVPQRGGQNGYSVLVALSIAKGYKIKFISLEEYEKIQKQGEHKCENCGHFKKRNNGKLGAIKGSCTLRCTNYHEDYRYGKIPACRHYIEA